MMRTISILVTGAALFALAAYGQNAPATSTPQTRSTAPAATGAASTSAQAAEAGATRNSATHGSRNAAQPGRQSGRRGGPAQSATQGGGDQPAAGQPGITGVPRYRAGFRGNRNATAPTATANVTVTGETDGSGAANPPQSAVLPGIPLMHNAYGIAKGTPLRVRLQQTVDSGHAKNGDTVRGVLVAAAGSAPAGAPVQLTVVAVAAAGQMTSGGELSLQVISVNGERVLSEVITAEGQEGPKLTLDAAPGRGTEAAFTSDQPLVLPAG